MPLSDRSENQSSVEAESVPEHTPPLSRPEQADPSAASEVQKMLDEEEREKELFGRIMADAREQETPLRELYARTTELAVPHKAGTGDAAAVSAAAETAEDEWSSGLDSSGNPRWITLSVPEHDEEEGIAPESVLPPSLEPPSKSPYQKDDKSQKKQAGSRHSSQGQTTESSRSGNIHLRPRRPRPLRNLFRMLLAVAILGMLYHILSQRGWVPKLF